MADSRQSEDEMLPEELPLGDSPRLSDGESLPDELPLDELPLGELPDELPLAPDTVCMGDVNAESLSSVRGGQRRGGAGRARGRGGRRRVSLSSTSIPSVLREVSHEVSAHVANTELAVVAPDVQRLARAQGMAEACLRAPLPIGGYVARVCFEALI